MCDDRIVELPLPPFYVDTHFGRREQDEGKEYGLTMARINNLA
jgi:hypothetical protein